ncbi:MAG: DinB family protein [Acidobacteria bacterium]|nr:DinB family protein [Acidobacteriota bacterium]
MIFAKRPALDECAPFYHGYLSQVPDGDIVVTLHRQGEETVAWASGLDPALARHSYGAGKWTIAQVLGHVADGERVFAHRVLWFARRHPDPLPGFDQDQFMGAAGFEDRSLASLADELAAARRASLSLVETLRPSDLDVRGVASGASCTVRALVWLLAGHWAHHRRILAERYV